MIRTTMKVISLVIATAAIITGLVWNTDYRNDLSAFVIENLLFSRFSRGILCIYLPNGKQLQYGLNPHVENSNHCDASIQINDASFWSDLLLNAGTTGLGETYMKQKWDALDTDGIHKVMYYITDNTVHLKTARLFKLLKSISPMEWFNHIRHYMTNRNKSTDQKHINVAYSIGNDFFQHMLDLRSMTYTCAIFANTTSFVSDISENEQELVTAQYNKYEIILRKLNVNSSDFKILEIGHGWGGLASFIQNRTGAYVTAINIAQPQVDYSNKRWVQKENDRLKYIHLHYNDIGQEFGANSMDRVVSVGCLEHAGEREQTLQFFSGAWKVLKPGGRLVLHFICRNNAFPDWKDFSQMDRCKYVTFIDQYIFPGACLQLPDQVHNTADKIGFKLIHKEYFGQHYVRTLAHWRQKLETEKSKQYIVDKYGVEIYRAYIYASSLSEAGFRVGANDLIHMVFIKPYVDNLYNTDIHYMNEIYI